jgi:hypothetical protein
MNPICLIGKWFWVMCIAVLLANAATFWSRAKKHTLYNPELEAGYKTIFKGLLFGGGVPWIVVGIGCVTGGLPSVFHLFRPRDGNPYTLVFFAMAFLLWIKGTYWLFFQNGAHMLVKHPGLFNVDFESPTTVKIFWLICLAGGLLGVIGMFTQDIPVPLK